MMKTISIEKAKHNAKTQSLDKENKDLAFYIILCNRTGNYYVDNNGLIRTWEQLIGCYENGVYNAEN
jgi:hypothetical protein